MPNHRANVSPEGVPGIDWCAIECDDYYPFGEQSSCGGTSTTTHKFTGYERDAESNLDNAQARYNSSSLGRSMSPDPLGNFVADATNPQTWNLYAYALNNPLAFSDPTGTDALDDLDCAGGGGGNDCGAIDTQEFPVVWENEFGFGTSYTLNGLPSPAWVAQGALSNPDAALACRDCDSPGMGLDSNGPFQRTLRGWIFIHCIWLSDGDACMLEQKGRFHLNVINPDDVYFSSDAAQMEYTLGLSGRLADGYLKSAVFNVALADTGAAIGALPTMNIAVGPGEPFHVAYGVGDTWLNAVGNNFFKMTVSRSLATETAEGAWFNISLPILNEGAVLATQGCSAWSCATAALSALGQGWLP